MRIALVCHGYPPELVGGTERYVAALARELVRRRHEVVVFAGSIEWREQLQVARGEVDGVVVERVHRDDLYFDRWDKGYHPGVSAAWDAFLDRHRPQVVHLHHWIRLSTDLVTIAAVRGVPTVITAHDLYPSCPRVFRLVGDDGDQACERPMGPEPCTGCVPRWRFQSDAEIARLVGVYRADMRAELALSRVVIAPTAGHGEFLRRMLDFAAVPIRNIPHGTLAPVIRRPVPEPAAARLEVACWSHLHPLKGAHVLLAAARRCARPERLRIHLLGAAVDPVYEQRLRGLAAGLDVVFHGAFEPADLQTLPMAVAVLPSLCRESYSFIFDEAVRLGVPIVAAATGALRERANGRVLLFERNDPQDLARRLDQLVADPDLLRSMRAAPAPRLLEFEDHVDQLLPVYAEAIGLGAPEVDRLALSCDRLIELWRRREEAFRELVRIERWEDVVAEQQRRIAELEQALRERR